MKVHFCLGTTIAFTVNPRILAKHPQNLTRGSILKIPSCNQPIHGILRLKFYTLLGSGFYGDYTGHSSKFLLYPQNSRFKFHWYLEASMFHHHNSQFLPIIKPANQTHKKWSLLETWRYSSWNFWRNHGVFNPCIKQAYQFLLAESAKLWDLLV